MAKILIVDTDESIQLLYADELTEEGYDVIACGDGSQVMALIEKQWPDLVVMEVLMGTYNGLDILQHISSTYHGLPVILCTTCSAFKEDLKSRAAWAYIVKSWNLAELKAVIKSLVDRERQYRPALYPKAGHTYELMPVEAIR